MSKQAPAWLKRYVDDKFEWAESRHSSTYLVRDDDCLLSQDTSPEMSGIYGPPCPDECYRIALTNGQLASMIRQSRWRTRTWHKIRATLWKLRYDRSE